MTQRLVKAGRAVDERRTPEIRPVTWHNIRRQLSDLDTVPLKRLVKGKIPASIRSP